MSCKRNSVADPFPLGLTQWLYLSGPEIAEMKLIYVLLHIEVLLLSFVPFSCVHVFTAVLRPNNL